MDDQNKGSLNRNIGYYEMNNRGKNHVKRRPKQKKFT